MDIWADCRDAVVPMALQGELIRFVESQEKIATNALVDNLDEQWLLEEMLEASKPPAVPQATQLHYLLTTPFRYPPLRHGSRFGSRFEPSLFYGSRDQDAAMAETAYYRFVFWTGMTEAPPSGKLTTEHTAFGACYAVEKGLCLQADPFVAYRERLIDPSHYADTQLLGRNMREAGVEAFEYLSARDPAHGINVVLFHARAFSRRQPLWQEAWLCQTRSQSVSFYNKSAGTRRYTLDQFLVAGDLPVPAV